MLNLDWSRGNLTAQKLGTFCEYYAKMALASYGLNVYTAEVDDHGIDFVAESKNGFLKFQVKSIRISTSQYVFMRKDYFDIEDKNLYLLLILLTDGEYPDTDRMHRKDPPRGRPSGTADSGKYRRLDLYAGGLRAVCGAGQSAGLRTDCGVHPAGRKRLCHIHGRLRDGYAGAVCGR